MTGTSEEVEDGRTARARRKREARRAELLVAAERSFGRAGYHATSINDVIKEAGVSRGTFYLYFDSKAALFHELIDEYVARLMGAVERVDPNGDDAVVNMLANLERVVGLLVSNPNLTKLLFREAVGLDDEVDEKLARLDEYMHTMARGALVKGARAGLIRPVHAPDVVAAAIVGMLREVVYQTLVTGRLAETDSDVVAQAIFEFGLMGLRLREASDVSEKALG